MHPLIVNTQRYYYHFSLFKVANQIDLFVKLCVLKIMGDK